MCIGLWSLDHPDYALYVEESASQCALAHPTPSSEFWRPIAMSTSHGQLPMRTSIRLEQNMMTTLFCLAAISKQAGPGSASTERAASLFCQSSSPSSKGILLTNRRATRTNINEPEDVYKESRGHLVTSFLLPNAPDAEHFVNLLENEGLTDYAGFNLLLLKPKVEGDPNRLVYEASLLTNTRGHGTIIRHMLVPEERRAGGMSNGADNIDGRDWPKVKKGVDLLVHLLYENETKLAEDELVEELFKILS